MNEPVVRPAESRYPQWAAASGLLYALGVFIVPLARRAAWPLWALSGASLVIFAWLYRDFLQQRDVRPRRALANLGLMVVLGVALMPWNVAAVTYVLYASALAPLVLVPRRAVQLFVLLAVTVIVELAVLDIQDRLVIASWVTFLIFATGMANLVFGERERQLAELRRAHEEIEGLATIAERERIARDLHDLLGHTLSVIALRSELASQLAETDTARAIAEIRSVEVVSREPLSEVRAAVEGYRAKGFSGELQRAAQALSASGVSVDVDVEPIPVIPKLETVLALVLREAVTNVIRHARASSCRVGLHGTDDSVVLTVEDDGVGGLRPNGSGLAGMQERVRGRAAGHSERERCRHSGHVSPPTRGRPVIRVVIAEDQSMVAGALAALLGNQPDIEVVATAHNGDDALTAVRTLKPDVLLTDIEMPGLSGLDVAAAVRLEASPPRVVILTTFARQGYLRRALEAGVFGYVLKDAPSSRLAEAIRRVHAGRRVVDPELAGDAWGDADPLSDRERQVLRLASEGRSGADIAAELHLSEGTVRNYLSDAIGKTGGRNRVDAARIARDKGWL